MAPTAGDGKKGGRAGPVTGGRGAGVEVAAALDDVVAAVLPDLWCVQDVAVTAKASIPSMAAIRVSFMVISPAVPT